MHQNRDPYISWLNAWAGAFCTALLLMAGAPPSVHAGVVRLTADPAATTDHAGNQWVPSPGNGLSCVNASAVGGGYDSSATKNKVLRVYMADKTDTAGLVVSSVKLGAYARCSGSAGVGDGGSFVVGAQTLARTYNWTTTFAYYETTMTSQPGAGAWTWYIIDTITAGVYSQKGAAAPTAWSVDFLYMDVSYQAPPVVSGSGGAANLNNSSYQGVNGGFDTVVVNYRLFDADSTTDTVKADYWDVDLGSWQRVDSLYVTGDFKRVLANNSTAAYSFKWAAGRQLTNKEWTASNIRIIVIDPAGSKDTVLRSSNNLVIDTKVPSSPTCYTPINASNWPGPFATLTANTATDGSRFYYYYEIDTVGSSFTGSVWQVSGSQSGTSWATSPMTIGGFYHWRVWAADTFGNTTAKSAEFTFQVSTTRPNIVIDSVRQTSTNGTGLLTNYIRMTDPQNDACSLLVWYSADNSAWSQALIASSTVGTLNNANVTGGTSRGQLRTVSTPTGNASFVWHSDSGGASGNQGGGVTGYDATVWIKAVARDVSGNASDTVRTSSFVVDNAAPTGAACSSPGSNAVNQPVSLTLTSSTAADNSTFSYNLQRATQADWSDSVNSGWQSGASWAVSSLAGGTKYYWRVTARDVYGNRSAYSAKDSFTTSSGWTFTVSPVAISTPALGNGVVYVGTGAGTNGSDSVIALNVLTGARLWSFSAMDDVSDICTYYQSGLGKWVIYFTTRGATGAGGNNSQLYAIADNGVSAAVIAGYPVDFGGKNLSSPPMADPSGTYLYNAYNANTAQKWTAVNGTASGTTGWPVSGLALSNTGTGIIDGASAYFPGSGGLVYKISVSNGATRSTATCGTASLDYPLGMWMGSIYVPSGTSLYSVSASTMGVTTWAMGGTVTSGAMRTYPVGQGGSATYKYTYLARGNQLLKVDITNGTVTASATLAGNISMPILTSDASKVFCIANNAGATAYAIRTSDLSTTAYSGSGWPKTITGATGLGNAPCVDETNSIVIFCGYVTATGVRTLYAYVMP